MRKIRKFDKKNKRYTKFLFIISLIIFLLFIYVIIKMITASHISFKINAKSVMFDSSNNIIRTTSNSSISKKWNRNYYLKYKGEKYNLGHSAVVYNEKSGSINLFGTFYEIKEKGEVSKITENTLFQSSVISKFYKISDRKYLIIDSSINSGNINTSNYLIVDIETNGYAFYSNNSVNLKTIEPTIINTSTYSFDVNNETLTFYSNKETIDLKKVLGSTNKYKSPSNKKNDGNNENSNTSNNNQSNKINQNGNGENSSITNNNVKNIINEINSNSNIDIEKRTSIIGVYSTSTQIIINYIVYDPKSEYEDIYVLLDGKKYDLNKSLNLLVIESLQPKTKYNLKFVYTYHYGEKLLENEFDNIDIETKSLNLNIRIKKIQSSKIYYVIDDNKINGLSYSVKLYKDNSIIECLDNCCENSNGFEKGIYILKLEDVSLNDIKINEDIYLKFSY